MSEYYPPSSTSYYADVDSTLSPYNQFPIAATVAEIVIIEPTSFNDIPEAIDALKRRQMVVLNLTHMDHAEAQRSVDFLAGGTIISNGTLERVDPKIFIFAPSSTEIIADGLPRNDNDSSDSEVSQAHQAALDHAFSRDRLLYRAS